MNPEYLRLFTKFHQDRMISFHSDKEYRCKGCDSERYFIIEENALIYSCSLDGEGKCGEQYRIDLPIYIDYDEEKSRLNHLLTTEKNSKAIQKQLKELETLYSQTNDVDTIEDKIKEVTKIREEHRIKKLHLMKDIQEIDSSTEDEEEIISIQH